MSNKVSNPNSKSNSGFLWGLVALVVIIAVVLVYIVSKSQGAKTEHLANYEVEDVAMSMTYDDNGITLSAPDAGKDVKTVELYEDFSCPHCGELATATDADFKTAVENGEFNVTIRTLNFLDGQDLENQQGHSTKAAAAMNTIAQAGDIKTYWNLRAYLLQNQSDVYNKWAMEDFAAAAEELGADKDVVNAIKDADIKAQGNEPAAANAKKLQDETGELSSPRVVYDGKDINGENESIGDWVSMAAAL